MCNMDSGNHETTYTNAEMVKMLVDFEEELAERIGCGRGNRTREIMEAVEKKARTYDLTGRQELTRLRGNMAKLGQTIARLKKGLTGEKRLQEALQPLSLDPEKRVLFNISLDDGNSCTEYDAIVISMTGVAVIEAKCIEPMAVINDRGFLIKPDDPGFRENLAGCMAKKRYLICKELGLNPNGLYREYVVNASESGKLTSDFERFPIYYVNTVVDVLAEESAEGRLSPEQVQEYAYTLQKADALLKGKCRVRVEEIRSDFECLKALFDEEARKAYEKRLAEWRAEREEAEREYTPEPQPEEESILGKVVGYVGAAIFGGVLTEVVRLLFRRRR